jgi:hypothetical protein
MTITVRFKRKKPWAFKWDVAQGWIYETHRNKYKLFLDYNEHGLDLWIGRFATMPGGGMWFTCEARLGAVSVEMFRGVFYFGQRPTKREGAVLSALESLQSGHVQDNKHRMGLLGAQDIDRTVKLLQGEINHDLRL